MTAAAEAVLVPSRHVHAVPMLRQSCASPAPVLCPLLCHPLLPSPPHPHPPLTLTLTLPCLPRRALGGTLCHAAGMLTRRVTAGAGEGEEGEAQGAVTCPLRLAPLVAMQVRAAAPQHRITSCRCCCPWPASLCFLTSTHLEAMAWG